MVDALTTLYTVGMAVFGFGALAFLLLATVFARYSSHRTMVALYACVVHTIIALVYLALRQDNGVYERPTDLVEIEFSRYGSYVVAQFVLVVLACDYFWQLLEPGWLAVALQTLSYVALFAGAMFGTRVRYLFWAVGCGVLAFNALSMYYGSRLRYQPTLAWRVLVGIALFAVSTATPVFALLCRPYLDTLTSKFTQELILAALDFAGYTGFCVYCYLTHTFRVQPHQQQTSK